MLVYVNVNGIRTRYFDKGKGETLVLVHGGQPSAPDFNAWEWQTKTSTASLNSFA